MRERRRMLISRIVVMMISDELPNSGHSCANRIFAAELYDIQRSTNWEGMIASLSFILQIHVKHKH